MVFKAFNQFLVDQEMDTDSVDIDAEIYNEENQSNLFQALREDVDLMNALRDFVRHSRIMGKSFATGIPLFYWEWHRNATEQEVKGDFYLDSYIDLGGHSVQELSVRPHFGSLKEEVLATGLLSPQHFQELVVQKAADYLKSDKCREMMSKNFSKHVRDDPLHFDIKKGSPLKAHHLHCIILYCDFTKLCTLFSRSLRKNKSGDGLTEIKQRNSMFFHFTKFLRELVTYFGSNGYEDDEIMNGVVKGPFFSGVSEVLNLSEFHIGFNTPTSTSMTKEVAWRFAGSGGMMICVGNQKGNSWAQPVFNATWISAFNEEDEYLWFGSVFKLSVENVSIVGLTRSYRQSIGALYLFSAALSGGNMEGVTVKKAVEQILSFCFQNIHDGLSSVAHKRVDQFVMDNVYCFRQSTTKLLLVLNDVHRMGFFFQNLIFYGMSKGYDIPKDRTNIFRASIFNLFPNLVEVEIWVWYNEKFNLLSLLSMLNELVIPSSFKVITIKQYGHPLWLKNAFNAIPNLVGKFAEKNWEIKQERVGKEEWVFIRPQ